MESPNPISMNSFLQSYASDRYAWESSRSCSRSAAFWTAFGYGHDVPKDGYASASAPRVISESGSLSSADMSISTDSSGEFMSCFSGHDADSCTSLSSSSSSAKVPMSVVAWLGLHDPRSISTPEAVQSPERLEGEACFLIYAWTLSLFVDVAQSALELDSVVPPPSTPSPSQAFSDGLWTPTGSPDRGMLVVTTKVPLFDLYEPASQAPTVNLTADRGAAAQDHTIAGNTDLVAMPKSIDYETINPEQSVTARNVCMWGRRQERIPKVRVPGQAEALYCFDERKLRQSQAARQLQAAQQRREPSVRPIHTTVQEVRPPGPAKGTVGSNQFTVHSTGPADASSTSKLKLAPVKALEASTRHPLSPRTGSYGGGNIPFVQKRSEPLKASSGEKVFRHPAGLGFIRVYRS